MRTLVFPGHESALLLSMDKKISKQRAYQLRHKEAGLCARCSEKAVNETHCEKHRKMVNRISRKSMQRRKEHKPV
jgi:hypothetical protein